VCLFAVTHFSTFAVGDAAVTKTSSSGPSKDPVIPSESSKPNIGAIVGGVIGAIALVVISAFVIMKMRQRSRDMAGDSEISKLAGKEMATTHQPL
jgi:flagellar biogenesis protein FliO